MSRGKGGVLRYTLVVVHPDTMVATPLLAGTSVPSWAKDLVHADDLKTRQGDESSDSAEIEGAGSGSGEFDPSDHTADEVNNHLADADEDEVARVLAAEAAGKSRKGVLEGPYAPEPDED